MTGGIGYITERTVGRVLDAAPTTSWLAALCLRWVDFTDFTDIAEACEARDLAVHKVEGVTYQQRRFADDEEQSYVLKELDRLDIDATGIETDGYHHADLFVLHPADEAPLRPLTQLISALD